MALTIKDRRAEALARELAARTGQSITQVLIEALEARLALVTPRCSAIDWDAVRAIQDDVATLSLLDARTDKEVCDELWGEPRGPSS